MLIWMPFTDLETQAPIASRLPVSLLGASALTLALAIGGYGQTAYAQTCEDIATGGDITRSVVVTAQDNVFEHADFSLERTLGQIIETAGAVDTPAERIAMVQSIVRSFNRPEFENPDSGLPGAGGGAAGSEPRSDQAARLPGRSGGHAPGRPVQPLRPRRCRVRDLRRAPHRLRARRRRAIRSPHDPDLRGRGAQSGAAARRGGLPANRPLLEGPGERERSGRAGDRASRRFSTPASTSTRTARPISTPVVQCR